MRRKAARSSLRERKRKRDLRREVKRERERERARGRKWREEGAKENLEKVAQEPHFSFAQRPRKGDH